jgi:uncharacterized membrane protein YdjX (TVP38/TMEM64 family)
MAFDLSALAPWFTPEALESGLVQAGIFAPLVYMVVLAGSIILPILPNAIVFFSGIVVLGVVRAVIYGYIGSLLGSSLAFFLAKQYGRPFVGRMVGESKIRDFEKRWGIHDENQLARLVFLFRLLPLLSFDLVSYAAGLTKISFHRFILAAAFAALPGTIAYILIGPQLGPWVFGFGVAWTILLGAFVLVAFYLARLKQKRQDKR